MALAREPAMGYEEETPSELGERVLENATSPRSKCSERSALW